ncbi:VOC family protein [Sphingobium sp. HBC34]|uniref:VOC family protein n=1 Tax=Sphingobium cyanobacteriorum TaxID=3063954 RepID=A0ABT8ZRR9_9SPHN|nr:VOC family protein [Sphingobium sp. HBC34]MDO7836141.1 VOC family protein [Sphingobium sp. HBC34]
MSILGVESVIYGVDNLPNCTKFWKDFGLNPVRLTEGDSIFDVASGSRIILMKDSDTRLPPRNFEGNGVRLTVWGVDTADALDRLVERLQKRVEVTRDADGSAFFQAPDGQYLGLRLWNKKAVVSAPDPVNAPGHIVRLNRHRQWRHKAIPKTINHVVFFSSDYVRSFEFYRDFLDFRYSDHSKGVGIFARADGTYEHHSIFWVNGDLPFAPDGHGFMHIAFGLDDIDEIMLGANIMERRGWQNSSMNSSGGISRHRISSALYYYVDCPAGGEAEYHADTDYLDDNWVPRAWDFKFGSLLWANRTPPIFAGNDIPWDMTFDPDGASFDPFRKPLPDPFGKDTSWHNPSGGSSPIMMPRASRWCAASTR